MNTMIEQDTAVHPLLSKRFSPRGFSERTVRMETLHSVFTAVRWSPSSYNEQPWRFIVARKDANPEAYEQLLASLNERNRQWARTAPVLVLAITSNTLARNGAGNKYSMYDLGQAVSTLTMQASHHDLYVHQMGGFDAEKAASAFQVPDGYDPGVVIALGYLPEHMTDAQIEERKRVRVRKDISELAFNGTWGRPLFPTMN